MHPPSVQPLPLKSGALQGALVVEYPFDHRFDSLHIARSLLIGETPGDRGEIDVGCDVCERKSLVHALCFELCDFALGVACAGLPTFFDLDE